MATHIAAPNRPRIVPAFVVRELPGKVERPLIQRDKEGKPFVKMVEMPAGYEVSFPMKGHSIRVKDAAELKRLGFDQTIPLVEDGENDDVVGYMPNSVLAGSKSN